MKWKKKQATSKLCWFTLLLVTNMEQAGHRWHQDAWRSLFVYAFRHSNHKTFRNTDIKK